MKHLLSQHQIYLEILQHSLPILCHHFLQLSELTANINTEMMERERAFVLTEVSSVLGAGCTPEVGGIDCPIYCCVVGMFPILEATSERGEPTVVDHDYIENEVSG